MSIREPPLDNVDDIDTTTEPGDTTFTAFLSVWPSVDALTSSFRYDLSGDQLSTRDHAFESIRIRVICTRST
jgi:hypothetical protein